MTMSDEARHDGPYEADDADDLGDVAAPVHGDDDDIEDHDDDRAAYLPAIKPEPVLAPSPLLRYDEIPAELAEALRGIINRYELRTGDALPNTIAVTSSLPGEGVTTASQSLATMIAQEMGSFVCWVDCGWLAAANDSEPRTDRPDLLDLLADNSRIHSAFQVSPDLPQLMSLAPGPVPEAKRNLIVRSPAFEQLLEVLAEEFDHVVFDLPPVLTNANGLALLRQADTSLFVVRHRATTLTQVQRALEAMQPTPNLGVILNRYRSSIPVRLRRLLGG
jgi:Mrp family chromosome partitioning ATPase